jgi:cell division septal protein FtsQ
LQIKLDDRRKSGRRKSQGRGRSKGVRTFETATTQPWVRPARKKRAGRRTPSRSEREASVRSSRSETQAKAEAASASNTPRISARIVGRSASARFWSALILVCLIGVIAYVSAHDKFYVTRPQVVGAHYVDRSSILGVAAVDQQNIFWIEPGKVEEQVAQLQGVKAVRVRCRLPASVEIEVTEREPVALWHVEGKGQESWVDEEGTVLPYAGDPQAPGTIFVIDSSARQLQAGAKIEPTDLVRSAQRLANVLPETNVFYYHPVRGLSFLQNSGGDEWPVYVGTSDDLPRKIRVMEVLTGYLAANNIRPTYVDVRTASHPLYGQPPGKTKKKDD